MIEVCFYNYGKGTLEVKKELKIESDADDFLTQKISGIESERTDHPADMDDNVIYYFSSRDEQRAAAEMEQLISSLLPASSEMHFSVRIKTHANAPGTTPPTGKPDVLPLGSNGRGAVFFCPKCGKRFAKMGLSCPFCGAKVFNR